MFRDVKHIHKTKIAKFASNLKIALRKAYGIKSTRFLRNLENTGITVYPQSHTLLQNYTPLLQNHTSDTRRNDTKNKVQSTQQRNNIDNRLMALANDKGNLYNQERGITGIDMDRNQELKKKIVEAFTTSLSLIFNG